MEKFKKVNTPKTIKKEERKVAAYINGAVWVNNILCQIMAEISLDLHKNPVAFEKKIEAARLQMSMNTCHDIFADMKRIENFYMEGLIYEY
jgi:hypothetical protein